jgi:hypothetical protein
MLCYCSKRLVLRALGADLRMDYYLLEVYRERAATPACSGGFDMDHSHLASSRSLCPGVQRCRYHACTPRVRHEPLFSRFGLKLFVRSSPGYPSHPTAVGCTLLSTSKYSNPTRTQLGRDANFRYPTRSGNASISEAMTASSMRCSSP